MKQLFSFVFVILISLSTVQAQTDSLSQSTPEGVAQIIFNAAKTGKFEQLRLICHQGLDTDGDSKQICTVADADKKSQASFAAYFSTGKIVGDVLIKGGNAKVVILFGPDGKKSESLIMLKKNEKWYLVSF